ncbi:MAG: DUF1995 family protein [Calothrix sp. MO_167.B12]|nr:DUF1995 family protein [Calothrix sp. MO_167.B12]
MSELPNSLEDAIAQAGTATKAALADGQTRLQVELLFPELNLMALAEQFLPFFTEYGDKLKVFFADAGAAGLARRDWAGVEFKIEDIGTGRASSAESKIQPEDEIFLFISPTSVEVNQLEKLCAVIGEARPIVILNPRLEDSGVVGIGYAARQTRDRFLSTIESSYYLRPIFAEAAVLRSYPGLWEVWQEKGGEYEKIAELPRKPSGDEIDMILASQGQTSAPGEAKPANKPNVFRGLQRFIRALRN